MLWIFAGITAMTGVGQMVAMIGAMVMFFRARGASEQSLQSRLTILENEQTRQSAEDEKLRARIHDMAANVQGLLLLQTKTDGRTESHEQRIAFLEQISRKIEREMIAFRASNGGKRAGDEDIHQTPR